MKTIHLDKEQVKAHDKLQSSIEVIFNFFIKNSKFTLIAIIALVAIFGGTSFISYLNQKNEVELQEKYYTAESSYLKKSEEASKLNTENKDTKKTEEVKKTENKTVDYTNELNTLKEVIEKSPSSQAAKMSGILLAEINRKNNNTTETLKYINLVKTSNNDTLSALFNHMKGQVLADSGDCKGAVSQWESNLNNKAADFLKDETKLNLAVCYQQLNETTKAESILNDIKMTAQPNKALVAKEAKKYLRYIQLKKKTI